MKCSPINNNYLLYQYNGSQNIHIVTKYKVLPVSNDCEDIFLDSILLESIIVKLTMAKIKLKVLFVVKPTNKSISLINIA